MTELKCRTDSTVDRSEAIKWAASEVPAEAHKWTRLRLYDAPHKLKYLNEETEKQVLSTSPFLMRSILTVEMDSALNGEFLVPVGYPHLISNVRVFSEFSRCPHIQSGV